MKFRIKLSLWCYRRGWFSLAYKIYPGIGWYIIGLDFAEKVNFVSTCLKALGEGYSAGRPEPGEEVVPDDA